MVGFIITGHGQFAPGIFSALTMVAGECERVVCVPFDEAAAATFSDDLTSEIASLAADCGEIVVFCDLIGGTPFNVAMMAACEIPGVQVVGGVNLPMVIETLFLRNANDALTATDLCGIAVASGTEGIAHKTLEAADATVCEDEEGI